jgi:hypothetical protein
MSDNGHPANPYSEGKDREGVDLPDAAQIGLPDPMPDPAPCFVLHANDPLAPMMVRYWAEASDYLGSPDKVAAAEARLIAARMDAWRARNSAGG